MIANCLASDAAWLTSDSGDNFDMLMGWVEKGWVSAEPPLAPGLASFRFTPVGRAALKSDPQQ